MSDANDQCNSFWLTNELRFRTKNMATSINEYLASNDRWAIAYVGIPLPLPYRIGCIEGHSACRYLDRQMEEILSSFRYQNPEFFIRETLADQYQQGQNNQQFQVDGNKAEIWSQAARKIHVLNHSLDKLSSEWA